MKRKNLTSIALLLTFVAFSSRADIYFAPYVSHSFGSIDQTGSTPQPGYAKMIGPGFGGKIGYEGDKIILGGNFNVSKQGLTLKNTDLIGDYDVKRTEWGPFIGVYLHKSVSLSLSYMISSKIEEIGPGDEMGTWTGTSLKLEFGVRPLSHVQLNCGYELGTYKKWESQNHSETQNALKSGTEWKTSGPFISIAFPFTFDVSRN